MRNRLLPAGFSSGGAALAAALLAGVCYGANPAPAIPALAPAAAASAQTAETDTLFRKETYTYRSIGRRDPFRSLVTRKGEGGGETDVSTLDASNVTLTGIIWGASGRLALVHDTQGVGYVLKAGDKIIGGSVYAITDTSVIFEQGDPGHTVKFIVPITKKEGRKK
ncbi:MAG: hypothetical protein QME74_09865 [Candidatus Edwardsbacteria bacterium]|nr:hypothetical protein [Candidatus Edwardsbacteria bacterium]